MQRKQWHLDNEYLKLEHHIFAELALNMRRRLSGLSLPTVGASSKTLFGFLRIRKADVGGTLSLRVARSMRCVRSLLLAQVVAVTVRVLGT